MFVESTCRSQDDPTLSPKGDSVTGLRHFVNGILYFSMRRLTHGIEQSVIRVPSVCENQRHLRTDKPSADDADFLQLKKMREIEEAK